MAKVLLRQPYVGQQEINETIALFQKIQAGTEPPLLHLEATQKIEDVDIALAGYFILFKESYRGELDILISLPHNPVASTGQELSYKLHQFATYAYLLTDSHVFRIDLGGQSFTHRLHPGRKFPTNWYVLSEHFMLLLYASKDRPDLFDLLFEEELANYLSHPLYDLPAGVDWDADNERLMKRLSRALVQEAVLTSTKQAILNLGWTAFFQALSSAGILPFYTESGYRSESQTWDETIKAGTLKDASRTKEKDAWNAKRYFTAVEPVFNELAKQPLIYHFVFATLTSSDLLAGPLTQATAEAKVVRLKHLWDFTVDMVHGLRELAKNVREHASTHQGVMTARIHTKEKFEALKGKVGHGQTLYQQYAEWLEGKQKGELEAVLEIQVFDLGETGIIPTLLQKTHELAGDTPADNPLNKLLVEDADMLTDGTVRIEHLISIDQPVQLNQQSKRCIAHLGLLTFSRLIDANQGAVIVHSPGPDGRLQTAMVPRLEGVKLSPVTTGTNYTILLPITAQKGYETHLPHTLQLPTDSSVEEINGMEALFTYQVVKSDDPFNENRSGPMIYSFSMPAWRSVRNRHDEALLWKEFSDAVKPFLSLPIGQSRGIIHIDFEKITIDESQLLRFLGQWEMYWPKVNLLISNLPTPIYLKLQDVNAEFIKKNPRLDYWNHQSAILVYHYSEEIRSAGDGSETVRFYFADVLWGRKYADFYALNRTLRRNHFTATTLQPLPIEHFPIPPDHYPTVMPPTNWLIFYHQNVLLPFDLLLKGPKKMSLFEHNAMLLLQNRMQAATPIAEGASLFDQIKSIPGYKIPKSHFRLGSKIHITNFYYAKRFFQNHFFASRFAFMLAKDIIDVIEKAIREPMTSMAAGNGLNAYKKALLDGGITLIGYGMYAELLLSLVEKFLHGVPAFKNTPIQHNLVEDSQDGKFVKRNKPKGLVVIIVPIASTFSTSLKIEEKLAEEKDCVILPPHFNLLYVADSVQGSGLSPLEIEFGWKTKDLANKQISLTAFFDSSPRPERVQKYFLLLPSRWQKVETCEDCFPKTAEGEEDVLEESPLFETDRTSVTPTIIFDFPKGRPIEATDRQRKAQITADMVRYGHHTRNHHHFIYSIHTERFLETNLSRVETWLRHEIKGAKDFTKRFPLTSHVLLISSCHFSNAAFLHLVNEVLFSSAANIIHYNPDQDYIQNFDLLYGLEISRADKIIFVDDSLKSGKTFAKINEFVTFTLSKQRETVHPMAKGTADGIEECLFLLNKAQPITMHAVRQKLKGSRRVHAFTHLHLFTNLSYDESASLVVEQARYQRLLEDSFLDSLKVHFLRQLEKIKVNASETGDEGRKQRHLLMLDASHRLYDYFSTRRLQPTEVTDFPSFAKQLFALSTSPLQFTEDHHRSSEIFREAEAGLLKVLTQSPFTQFEPLRTMVFGWVLGMLKDQLAKTCSAIAGNNLTYEKFLDLKFLIRRAGLLNSNFLISRYMLENLALLYTENGLPGLERKIEKEQVAATARRELFDNPLSAAQVNRKKQNLRDFHVFYLAQVKELLLLNEARSIHLENVLQKLSPGAPGYNQIIRILRTENSIIIQRFYEFLSLHKEWPTLYPERLDNNRLNRSTDKITEFLQRSNIRQHHRFRTLEAFFETTGQELPLHDNGPLLDFLWIHLFLAADAEPEKEEEQVEGLKETSTEEDPSKCGATTTDTPAPEEKPAAKKDAKITTVQLAHRTDSLFTKLKEILRYANQSEEVSGPGAFMIIRGSAKSFFLAYDKNYENLPELDSTNWDNPKDGLLKKFLLGMKDESGMYYKSIMELKWNKGLERWEDMYAIAPETENPVELELHPSLSNRMILLRLSQRRKDGSDHNQGIIGLYFGSNSPDVTSANYIRYLILLRNSLSKYVERHYQSNEYREWYVAESTKRLALLSGHGKHMLQGIAGKGRPYGMIPQNLEQLQMIILMDETEKAKSGESKLVAVFNQFYDVDGAEVITPAYANVLATMAEDIFSWKEIETAAPCKKPKIDIKNDFAFAFHKNLLNLICFEIILNAKKNRWHFLTNDPSPVPIDNNEIEIIMEHLPGSKGNQLRIGITSTGPTIRPGLLSRLNNQNNAYVKAHEAISGTALLKTLTNKILGGRCDFFNDEIAPDIKLSRFRVEILLNEMKKKA